ncbi:MAG TPA: glycosyl hydrolase [Bryobacteraceae bacterium]|nr:glycosyl hydrolase [Bryobacteraceae bacterium]
MPPTAPNLPQRQTPIYWGTNAVLYDDQDVSLIGSLGNRGKVSARVTYYWSDIEPTEGNWQFAVYDALVKRATDADIPILGILAYAMKRVATAATDLQGDPWALSYCPPDDIDQFATFVGTVVARYPQVLYWEVWNEPNTTYFWRPSPDPGRYVELLKASYAAIKGANPQAVVVLGGLSPGTGNGQVNTMSASSFLETVYQDGGENYFDAVGFHPYNDGVSPDLYLAGYVNSVHDVMTQYGDANKKLWVTEIGSFVGTQGNALSETQQADYLSRAFTILYGMDSVERVYWYNLKVYSNPATPVPSSPPTTCGPGTGPPVDYGLFRYDGSPRSAAEAFKQATR